MNNGLSASLKEAFPGIIPVPRPVVVDQEIKAGRLRSRRIGLLDLLAPRVVF